MTCIDVYVIDSFFFSGAFELSPMPSPSAEQNIQQRRQDNLGIMPPPPPPPAPLANQDPQLESRDHDITNEPAYENRLSNMYEVVRDNPYDALSPQYANTDFNPETDAYTGLAGKRRVVRE
jgi:hypothetical protein